MKSVRKIIVLILAAVSVLTLAACSQEKEPPRTVRVAIIDTGISTDAIPAELIGLGANYLDSEKTTADTYGHGTAVASVILENAENVILVPLVSNMYVKGKISFVDTATFA